jgi:hypothetical protein
MKEIVLVRLAIDPQTGAVDPTAPFMVIPRRRALQRLPGRGGIYENEPGVIEQFRPGDREAQFEAEWSKVEAGRRVEIWQAHRRCLINPAASHHPRSGYVFHTSAESCPSSGTTPEPLHVGQRPSSSVP